MQEQRDEMEVKSSVAYKAICSDRMPAHSYVCFAGPIFARTMTMLPDSSGRK